jgi:hypothetical protein
MTQAKNLSYLNQIKATKWVDIEIFQNFKTFKVCFILLANHKLAVHWCSVDEHNPVHFYKILINSQSQLGANRLIIQSKHNWLNSLIPQYYNKVSKSLSLKTDWKFKCF